MDLRRTERGMVQTVAGPVKVEIVNYFFENHYLGLVKLNSGNFDILDRVSQ